MRSISALSVLLILLSSCGDGSSLPSNLGAAGDGGLGSILDAVRVDSDLPSLAAVTVHGDQVIERAAIGVRAAGSNTPVTINDKWHIGSLTKAMTGMLAAVLVEQGGVTWSTTIEDVFPDFVGAIRPEYHDVTLDELLYHISGLPVDIGRAPISRRHRSTAWASAFG